MQNHTNNQSNNVVTWKEELLNHGVSEQVATLFINLKNLEKKYWIYKLIEDEKNILNILNNIIAIPKYLNEIFPWSDIILVENKDKDFLLQGHVTLKDEYDIEKFFLNLDQHIILNILHNTELKIENSIQLNNNQRGQLFRYIINKELDINGFKKNIKNNITKLHPDMNFEKEARKLAETLNNPPNTQENVPLNQLNKKYIPYLFSNQKFEIISRMIRGCLEYGDWETKEFIKQRRREYITYLETHTTDERTIKNDMMDLLESDDIINNTELFQQIKTRKGNANRNIYQKQKN